MAVARQHMYQVVREVAWAGGEDVPSRPTGPVPSLDHVTFQPFPYLNEGGAQADF